MYRTQSQTGMMDEKTVKKNILRSRNEIKLSQQQIADRMGISRNAYRSLESGPTRIISDKLEKLAEITGKTQEELVLGYQPVEDLEGEINRVRERFTRQTEAERSQHEARVADLEKEVAFQQEYIQSLKNHINTLEAYIRSLERDLGRKDAAPED